MILISRQFHCETISIGFLICHSFEWVRQFYLSQIEIEFHRKYITRTSIFTLFLCGLYDSFLKQLSRFSRSETQPTKFTCLLVCFSAGHRSCINMRLFSIAVTKLDSLTFILCGSQIALHIFESQDSSLQAWTSSLLFPLDLYSPWFWIFGFRLDGSSSKSNCFC